MGPVSGGQRSNPVAGAAWRRVLSCAIAVALLAAGGLAGGCSDSGGDGVYEDALSLVAPESGTEAARDGAVTAGSEPDLHDLGRAELRDGPAVQHLMIARLLSEVGMIEMLNSYIVNIPTGAYFLHNFETQAAMSAATWAHRAAEEHNDVAHGLEQQVLIAVDGDALNRPSAPAGPDPLHDAFFEVFEQCGRDSPWPDVKLADREGNSAGDVLYLDPELGISLYEYRELLHVCGRYAVTYPTLDPEVRDELLSSQRAYFARGILDRLDNELPSVEIPAKYQAEVDELRKSGW